MGSSVSFQSTNDQPTRLDNLLLAYFAQQKDWKGITRSQLKLWIEAGKVSVAGTTVQKSGFSVNPGSTIQVSAGPHPQAPLEPYPFELQFLYEDEFLVVINKPAGLSMHPGAGERTKTLANALISHYGKKTVFFAEGLRAGIVHRLDKDTSGVVVVAKDVNTQNQLSKQFAAHSVDRAYRALVYCPPRGSRILRKSDQGTVETAIGRDPNRKTAMKVLESGGKLAITHWQVLEKMQQSVLLELKLKTGRTHQIRVHMQHLSCPVLGDRTYGNFSDLPAVLRHAQHSFGRQALHAFRLGFIHPQKNKKLEFESPLPEDFQRLIELFRKN